MKIPLLASAAALLATSLALAQSPPVVEFVVPAQAGHPVIEAPQLGCCSMQHGPTGKCWVAAEYLMWWVKDGPGGPPVLTTGTPASSGILGHPDTVVLAGGRDIDYGRFNGGRISYGIWLDDQESLGFLSNSFLLEQRSLFLGVGSDGTTVLSRPIIDAQTGAEQVQRISLPGAFAGILDGATSSQLWGFDSNLAVKLCNTGFFRLHGLAGFRYLGLEEDSTAFQSSVVLPNGIVGFNGAQVIDPNQLSIYDSLTAKNNFYGGQVGAQARCYLGPLGLGLTAKVALGVTNQELESFGSTTLIRRPANMVTTVPGGLYSLRSNSGKYDTNEFTVVPEVEARMSYTFKGHLTAFVGYTFLYWSSVARPGDQVDRTIDRRALPSSLAFDPAAATTRPARLFEQSDFWAQGINFGMELRF